jgi:hypothetical protein
MESNLSLVRWKDWAARRFLHDLRGVLKAMGGVSFAVLAAILIGMLYLGREVFIPIALAVLLSFVLAPFARLLQRLRLPRGLSVATVVLLAFVGIFALGGVIATQINQLAVDLPRYEANMREKIKSVRGTAATSGTLERAADVLQDLSKELNKPKDAAPLPSGQSQSSSVGQEIKPIPVEVRQPPPTALEYRGADFAAAPAAYYNWHYRNICDFYPSAEAGSARSINQAGRGT